MMIFDAEQANQGSPWWWELRRGIPTTSAFDRIITPKRAEYSSQAQGYMLELVRDVIDQRPNWYSEQSNKPPNHAIAEGIRREAESRNWLSMEREQDIFQVGFCLSDNGHWGCSPDGLLLSDSGTFAATVELKNPQGDTHARYLLSGELPPEYRCQVHGHLLVTGLPRCVFCSYHHDFLKTGGQLIVEVVPDEFTCRLKDALERFTREYLDVLTRLRLLKRFEDQRAATLRHFEAPKC